MKVDEILTLLTHKDLFQPTRQMDGVASAPGIFQREIGNIFNSMDYGIM